MSDRLSAHLLYLHFLKGYIFVVTEHQPKGASFTVRSAIIINPHDFEIYKQYGIKRATLKDIEDMMEENSIKPGLPSIADIMGSE